MVNTPPVNWMSLLQQRVKTGLPGHLGFEVDEVGAGHIVLLLTLQPYHLAPNGCLHAGTVVTMADTTCGFGCLSNLPEGATNFTTIELKTSFLRTALQGTIRAEGTLVHGGRRTQVWDATVFDDERRALALFRCTQMLIYD